MFCPHCGEGNRDDAAVCELCKEVMPGRVRRTSITPPLAPHTAATPVSRKGGVSSTWLVVLAIAVVGAGAFFLKRKSTAPISLVAAEIPAQPSIAHPAAVPLVPRPVRAFNDTTKPKLREEIVPSAAGIGLVSSRFFEGASGLAQARAEQQQTGAPMLLYFRVDWCPYCKAFDAEVLPASAVRAFLGEVVKVKINPETSAEDKAAAHSFGVSAYPTVLVIPRPGAEPIRVRGFSRVGDEAINVTAERFVQACEQIGLRQKRADLIQAVQNADSGDLEATRRAFDDVIRNDSNNADAYVRRGIVEANANELGKAAGYFKKAISLAPDDPTPYLNLAKIYVSAGQIDDEVRVYDDMVRRLPDWRQGHAFAARADARRRKGDTAGAKSDFEEACRRGNSVCQVPR